MIKGMFDTSLDSLHELNACTMGLIRFKRNVLREDGTISLADIVKQNNNLPSDVTWLIAKVVYGSLTQEQLHKLVHVLINWLRQPNNEKVLHCPGVLSRYFVAIGYVDTGKLPCYTLDQCCYFMLDDIITTYYINRNNIEILELLEQL